VPGGSLISPTVRARAAYVTLFAAIGAMAPYIPVYYQSLGLRLDAVGLLGALSAAAGLIGAPLWGAVADRFGTSRLVMPAAAGAATIAAGLLALVTGPVAVVVAVAALGVAMGGVSPILDARALETVATDRNRYGRLRVWGSASFIVGTVVTGLLIQQTGIRGLFIVLVLGLMATALVGLGIRSQELLPSLPRLGGIRAVLRNPVLVPFLLAALLAWSAASAINGFFSIHLVQIGAPESLVGISWALGALVEVPVMIAFPIVGARFGVERLLLLGSLLFVLRAIIVVVVRDPVLVTLSMAVHGAAFALVLVGGVTYVSRHAPPGTAATAQGILSAMTFGLASILGPGIGGLLAPRLGLPGMFLVAAVASAIGVAAVARSLSLPRGRSVPGSTARPAT
jgi:PPP family 3-phenylpropionic acid transporter